MGTVIGERLLYLPSIGYCMALAVLGQRLATYLKSSDMVIPRHLPSYPPFPQARRFLPLLLPLVSFVLVVFVIRTHARTLVWENGETLFINDGYAQIASAKTQFNLGITYMMMQDYDLAIAALVRCARAGGSGGGGGDVCSYVQTPCPPCHTFVLVKLRSCVVTLHLPSAGSLKQVQSSARA